ncbi:biliverdin-producing heme oxygenase [Sphingomonas sp. MMS24-J13]|uniref:biliverdin-producing heme oxygenase n=1 Tax=Sphingomonas sp. MMS24-J13 TaxID=3238686 RepID=UPI00384EFFC7
MSALARLRAATKADHEAVDAAFGRFQLTDAAAYGAFLTAHARALPAVEAALADIAGLPPLRPRTPLIHADLAALGIPLPEPLPLPAPADHATAFGMAYVIDGSRLGGGMLARQVPADLPRAYLSATHLAGEWRAFGQALDAAAEDAAWTARAITGAKRVFDLYAQAAR